MDVKPACVFAVLAVAWCLAAPPAAAQIQGLPLEVVNPTDQQLSGHPVAFGVPLPSGTGLTDASLPGMTVLDPQGTPVPCQFKALSRWDGARDDASKELKWVLASFLADCPPESTSQYVLAPGARPGGSIVTHVQPSRLIVLTEQDTGFAINRTAFTLFDDVMVEGEQVLEGPGGLEMIDTSGSPVPVQVTETTFEETGSVRAVVRQKGTLGGLRFTVRYYFYSGRHDVTVDFRLENPGAYGVFNGVQSSHEHFEALNLHLPVSGASGNVTTTTTTRQCGQQHYSLLQDFSWYSPYDLHTGFQYSETIGLSTVGSGGRYPGAIDLSGSGGGVTVAVDRFWQNFPKAFRVDGSVLRIALWPSEGDGPHYTGVYGGPTDPVTDPLAVDYYRFEGGRWKTHRVVFDFHKGLRTPAGVQALAERTAAPPAGRPEPEWIKGSAALGVPFVERRDWAHVSNQRYEQFYDMLIDDQAADTVPGLGKIGLESFRRRGGTYGGVQSFGWENFGDIFWGEGASSLHYDWTRSVLMQWLRGGDYGFFDTGRDMAWHMRDYDFNHSTDTDEGWRGAARYEKGWWHGNFRFGELSHTWVHGVLMHYVITGEEGSRESALQTADWLMRNPPGNWNGYYGARIPGWSIENLFDCWNYLGDPAYLAAAKAGMDRFLEKEQLPENGGNGYVLNPANANSNYPAFAKPFMHAYFFLAAARYSAFAGDPDYLPLLKRMRDWFRDDCLILPGGTVSNVTMPAVQKSWAPGYTNGTSVNHTWLLIDVFTYSHFLTGSVEDAQIATALFETMTRFHQHAQVDVVDYFDWSDYSSVSMRMLMFPGSESKIMGNILRAGVTYLAMSAYYEN